MSRSVWVGLVIGLSMALSISFGASTAIALPPPMLAYEGGPVMPAFHTAEVVWSHEGESEEAANVEGLDKFLGDIAAASGSIDNVFSTLAQYSTVGLSPKDGVGEIAAYDSTYLGSFPLAPTTSSTIQDSQIQKALTEGIEGGHLPTPSADGNGTPETIYTVVMPPNVMVCLEGSCSGPSDSSSAFCGYHGSGKYGSIPYTYDIVLDLSGELRLGCGESSSQLANETSNLSHHIAESVTDPLVNEGIVSWYDNAHGEIGDYCDTVASHEVEQEINGHKWTVQKIWSNADDACVASDDLFTPPSASFSATSSVNVASFSASGESTNNLAHVPAGIASYSWDFGDRQTGSGATPSHSYAAAGTYIVTLTATDSLGFTAHVSHEVTVSAPPPTTTGGGTNNGGGTTSSTAGAGNNPTSSNGNALAALSLSDIASGGPVTTTASGAVTSGERISCPASGGLCVVSLKGEIESAPAKHKGKKHKVIVASATITISPGSTAKIAFKLNGVGKSQLLSNGHLLVKLTLTLRQGNGAPVVSSHAISLKAPKRHRHKR